MIYFSLSSYFSPERCDPDHEWTIGDHLYVDIWALGVTLYQLITLEHPFVPDADESSLDEGDESDQIVHNIKNVKLKFHQPCWRKEYDITRKYGYTLFFSLHIYIYLSKFNINTNNNNNKIRC